MLRSSCWSSECAGLGDVVFATDPHEVSHSGELVRGGGVSAGFIHPTAEPAVERGQRVIAVRDAHGCNLQRLADPVS